MSKLSEALIDAALDNPYCTFSVLRSELAPDDTKALNEALDRKVPSYIIAKILRAEGFKISHDTIETHRTSKCKCFGDK